ncbi:response regulator transcription factor [Christensenellaceae bacterium OttesenSCG-928-M15]|nr:response regulator transcription factor [Christensenellaceae bacterium OttesenSCG-928-M15]
MYKVLIADDEAKLRQLVKKYAIFEGHSVEEASTGMEAVLRCREETFDIVIMDVMMPELDGFSAVKEIRKSSDVPVIMLSARGEEYDRIHGFESGVDDYVVKPFSPKELMMRIDAVMKRFRTSNEGGQDAHDIYSKEGLVVDFTARIVYVNNEQVTLSPKECDLLFYLVRNRNIALKREQILTEVWGYDFFGDDRTLDTHIKMLRKALKQHSGKIVTLRGTGYRFDG